MTGLKPTKNYFNYKTRSGDGHFLKWLIIWAGVIICVGVKGSYLILEPMINSGRAVSLD